nr:hypothetical protein GCM10020185_78560 [Pseudomonas brassicacearum subsp. brassicacearum]
MLFVALPMAPKNGAPTTAVGVYDFGAGMMPPATPFGTVGLRTAFYSANVQKDRHGKSVDNNLSLDVLSIAVAYMRMTDYTVLGAKYGFGAVVPFFSRWMPRYRCRRLSARWTLRPIRFAWLISRCCR